MTIKAPPARRAIRTRYFSPSNTRGARIQATAGVGQTIFIQYPYELDNDARHRAAALALIDKFGLDWQLHDAIGVFGNDYFHTIKFKGE